MVSGFSDAQLTAAFNFIGSAASGFVGAIANLRPVRRPGQRAAERGGEGLANTDVDLQSQINTLTSQMTVMQTNLASQLSTADSLIAELQSQQTELSGSLQSLSLVLYGQDPGQI